MSNKTKKKPKKTDKQKSAKHEGDRAEILHLKAQVKSLKKEIRKRDKLIEAMSGSHEKDKPAKNKKDKPKKHRPNPLFKSQEKRVGVMQKQAWQRHGFLRDRYEFHLLEGREKSEARALADRDLRDKHGEDAGYTDQELEDILS